MLTSETVCAGVGAALYQQARTGRGEKVMVSLYSNAIWALGVGVQSTQYGDEYPKTGKMQFPPLVNSYRCADGVWIYMCVIDHERYYNAVMRAIDREDLVDHPLYSDLAACKPVTPELIRVIEEGFQRYDHQEMHRRLTEADVAPPILTRSKTSSTTRRRWRTTMSIHTPCGTGAPASDRPPPLNSERWRIPSIVFPLSSVSILWRSCWSMGTAVKKSTRCSRARSSASMPRNNPLHFQKRPS